MSPRKTLDELAAEEMAKRAPEREHAEPTLPTDVLGITPPKPPTQPPPPVVSDRKTPDEWRIVKLTRASHYACAKQLHGWRLHEHHAGGPMHLTEAAYDAAIKAGQQMPCTPHPDAVSPHLGKGL